MAGIGIPRHWGCCRVDGTRPNATAARATGCQLYHGINDLDQRALDNMFYSTLVDQTLSRPSRVSITHSISTLIR